MNKDKDMNNQILMKGNEALAEAAIIAGCRFYFGYPITPQNEVPAYMAKRMPEVGGTFLQAESEIAAINMVYGAAAAGARVMTSSSSPGISLKQEGISYIAGAELPCVVVNIMRGGPGLGNIAGSQGDYFQSTRGGGNGDYRNIVLTPATVQEMADLAVLAFDLADKYRITVLILGDGYLGQMSEALTLPKPSGKTFEKPWALTGAKGRKPNKVASLRLIPEAALEELNLVLEEKYQKIKASESRSESYKTEDAEYLLVSYGTSSRICKQAVNELRKEGIKAGLFRLITAWPFPADALQEASAKAKKILTVEMSLGQMIEDVKLSVKNPERVDFYGRSGGMLPETDEIKRRIKAYGN